MTAKYVQIGETGKRIGESHGRAKLTDHEVELVRTLWEEGMPASEIAVKMEISKKYVYELVNFKYRASLVAQWRKVVTLKKRRKQ